MKKILMNTLILIPLIFVLFVGCEPEPEFGIEKFDGYYEGTIDFMGIITGKESACVQEDFTGEVTGDFFTAIESSGEYMNGTLVDGLNSSDTGVSVITGTIEIPLETLTAHIIIEGLQYNLSTGEWVGPIYQQEQSVPGKMALTWVSDECPEGWNEK